MELVSSQPVQVLFLRSDDATQTYTDGRRVFELKNQIIAFKGHKIMVQLLEFECPISYYLFDSTNNLLSITVTGNVEKETINFSISQGNYNAQTLATELNTLAGSHFTFAAAFEQRTLKYTLTVSASNGNSSISLFEINNTSTCLKVLGFNLNGAQSTSSLTSDNVANLNRTTNLYIRIPNIRLLNLDSRGVVNSTIGKIQQTEPHGEILHYVNHNADLKFVIDEHDIEKIELIVEDDDGKIVDFNNLPYHLTLGFYFILEDRYLPPPSLELKIQELENKMRD